MFQLRVALCILGARARSIYYIWWTHWQIVKRLNINFIYTLCAALLLTMQKCVIVINSHVSTLRWVIIKNYNKFHLKKDPPQKNLMRQQLLDARTDEKHIINLVWPKL